jgi:chemotaxis protein methyltransferase CheR
MTDTITANEFKLLRDLIEKWCGISLGNEKAYLIETRLMGLLAQSGCEDYGAFYRLAVNDPSPQLRDKIVDAITTNETLWFRDGHPFLILREQLLPGLAAELAKGSRFRIRIWSGASSTGQEAYSIAMTIHEFCAANPGLRPDQFEIIGTDISPSALFLAKAGRYDEAALARGLAPERRARFFHQEGAVWAVNDEVKRMVSFRKYNLQDPLEPLGRFDIVFMRYVSIYFSEPLKRTIYAGVARLLAPDGHLIISAVESLRGISDEFLQLSHANGTYYRCQPAMSEVCDAKGAFGR